MAASVISVISGKGGTGKSTLCAALSVSLAKMGKRVLAVDMDIGLRSLDILLSLESKAVFDIGDVMQKNCEPKDALISHPQIKSLSLLCSPITLPKDFSASAMLDTVGALIKELEESLDFVFLDLPPGLGLSVMATRELADQCILVTAPEAVALRDTAALSRIIRELKKPAKLIINHISKAALFLSGVSNLDEIINRVGLPLLAAVPEDPWIQLAISGEKKGPREAKNSLAPKIINAAAQRILSKQVPIILREIR